MAIARESIDKFLNRVHAELPRFKGADPLDLDRMIFDCTGAFYEEKTQSRPHQLEGLAFALYMRRAMLFYWMRLGKSKIALDWASQLKRAKLAVLKGLIIAHSSVGANDVWPGQVQQHSHLSTVTITSGPKASDRLVDALESDVDLIIMSISTIQALFTEKRLNRKDVPKLYPARDLLELVAAYFDHVIIDEPHLYASSPWSLPFELCSEIASKCKYRLALTGTPIGRKVWQIWSQAYLVDEGAHFGYHYKFFEEAFKRRTKQKTFEPVFDKRLMPILQYKLDAFTLSYAKDEVKTAAVFEGIVNLRMTAEQQKVYNDVVDKLTQTRLDDTAEVENVFIRLRRIASGYLPFTDEDGAEQVLRFSNTSKLEWLRDFVSEVPSGMQCLIFHEFISSGQFICDLLSDCKATYAWLYGGTKDKSRELARFKSGEAQFLVANTATGGTAIDLPEVDYICFFESPCDPRMREQAKARPMARGDRPLVIDDLVCAPIEEKILGFIAEGANLLHTVLRGKRKALGDMLRAK